MSPKNKEIRQPITKGLFYPSEPDDLAILVDSTLAGDKKDAPALILPHADYDITARACGAAWQQTALRRTERVLLLAPVHGESDRGAFFSPARAFASPLGDIQVDRRLQDELANLSPLFKTDPMPHEEEHSMELTLPYISRLHENARIIPLLLGGNRKSDLRKMAAALGKALAPVKETLLVIISSNLSAYLPCEEAREQADNFVKLATGRDAGGGISACGENGLDLLNFAGLFKGHFELAERFSAERKENRIMRAVEYGTFVFRED